MTAAAVSPAEAIPAPGDRLGRGLLLLVWLLPFHVLAMTVLFGVLGVSAPLVRAISAWKEAVVGILFAAVVVGSVAGRGHRSPVRAADLVVAGLGLLAVVYLAGAGVWFGGDLPLGAQALGLRDAAVFTLLYFVGRATPEVARDPRYLRAIVAVGAVTSVIAIFERLFVTPQMLVVLGAARYLQDFLGLAVTTTHNPYGLSDSYWQILGSHLVQRAGSTYLSSQSFAVPFVVIVPAATVWLFTAGQGRRWAGAALAAVWIGLLLSITRMTTIACLVEVLVLAVLYRRWGVALGGGLLLTLGVALAALLIPGFATYLWQTLTWRSASSVSHLSDWTQGLSFLVQHPLGVGLGAGGLLAARFGLPTVAADSQYFAYTVQLGLPGLGLFLAVLAGFVAAGARAFRAGPGETVRAYGALVAVVALGVALNGITTTVLASPLLAYTFFWLAGSVVSAVGERP